MLKFSRSLQDPVVGSPAQRKVHGAQDPLGEAPREQAKYGATVFPGIVKNTLSGV